MEDVDEGSDEGDEIDNFIVDDDGVPSKKKSKKRKGMDYDDRSGFEFISCLMGPTNPKILKIKMAIILYCNNIAEYDWNYLMMDFNLFFIVLHLILIINFSFHHTGESFADLRMSALSKLVIFQNLNFPLKMEKLCPGCYVFLCIF